MINELIFLIQIVVVAGIVAFATRWGKEGLVAITALLAVLANLFITKEILLCSMHVTATDTLGIGCGVALNMLQKQHGFKTAKNAVFISFFCLLVCAVMVQIHVWYVPAPSDIQHAHFCALFASMPRIIVASLGSYLVAQYLDCTIYRIMHERFFYLPEFVRNYASLAISQLFDTVIFSVAGLWGIMSNIGHIIIVSYSIKLVTIVLIVPLTWRLFLAGKRL